MISSPPIISQQIHHKHHKKCHKTNFQVKSPVIFGYIEVIPMRFHIFSKSLCVFCAGPRSRPTSTRISSAPAALWRWWHGNLTGIQIDQFHQLKKLLFGSWNCLVDLSGPSISFKSHNSCFSYMDQIYQYIQAWGYHQLPSCTLLSLSQHLVSEPSRTLAPWSSSACPPDWRARCDLPRSLWRCAEVAGDPWGPPPSCPAQRWSSKCGEKKTAP